MRKRGEPKDPPDFGHHYGDLGVIAIAALFSVAFAFLMFGPSPLKGLDKFDEAVDRTRALQLKAARQKQIDEAVASGVISVGIAPADHPAKAPAP